MVVCEDTNAGATCSTGDRPNMAITDGGVGSKRPAYAVQVDIIGVHALYIYRVYPGKVGAIELNADGATRARCVDQSKIKDPSAKAEVARPAWSLPPNHWSSRKAALCLYDGNPSTSHKANVVRSDEQRVTNKVGTGREEDNATPRILDSTDSRLDSVRVIGNPI